MFDLAPVLKQRFFDSNGVPLVGGQLFSYIAGTTTPQATYTDETGDTPNTNPVILDANGEADVWMADGSYKFILQDSLGNVQWTVDQVLSPAAQIAEAINTAGALAATNNLSDLTSVPIALQNLGIAPFTYPTRFAFTSGQLATALSGERFDGLTYSSVIYEYEIQQALTGGFFVVSSANASNGATYTNNGSTFAVIGNIMAGLLLQFTGTGTPSTSGTLTKTSGTGDATITFSQMIPWSSILATGTFSLQYLDGTWVCVQGESRGTAHGITFSLFQPSTVCQLKIAESGLGNGTIKLKKSYFFA